MGRLTCTGNTDETYVTDLRRKLYQTIASTRSSYMRRLMLVTRPVMAAR